MPIEYENLEIELSRCSCGVREVRILDSPVDRPRAPLEMSESALHDLQQEVDRYDSLLLEPDPVSQEEARQLSRRIGIKLFEALTPGHVGSSVKESLLLLDRDREQRNVGRRLRFSFSQGSSYDPLLANLPWELICDPRTGSRFLGCEPMTQVARYLEISRKVKPLAIESTLRVLGVFASPRDQPAIDLEKQELKVRRAVEGSSQRLDFRVLERPTLRALVQTLKQAETRGRPFHVLHFLGHGELTSSGQGAFYFEDDVRLQHVISGQVLATQIAAFRDLRLVVLATCSGARLPRRQGQSAFSGIASALIAANIPAVVAMQFNISVKAAAAFTSAFYSRLGELCPLDEAVAQGRLAILADDVDGSEWATPVLFLRTPDGQVFSRKQAGPLKARKEPTWKEVGRVSIEDSRLGAGRDLNVVGLQRDAAARSPGSEAAATKVTNSTLKAGRDVTVSGTKKP